MKHQVNFYTDLVRREGRKNKTKGKNKNNLILMFIVDDCSSFAHFEGSTLTTQWVGEGGGGKGGVFNPSTPGVNKERKMLFWYLSLWTESHGVAI